MPVHNYYVPARGNLRFTAVVVVPFLKIDGAVGSLAALIPRSWSRVEAAGIKLL